MIPTTSFRWKLYPFMHRQLPKKNSFGILDGFKTGEIQKIMQAEENHNPCKLGWEPSISLPCIQMKPNRIV
jgi:hypothetical protein